MDYGLGRCQHLPYDNDVVRDRMIRFYYLDESAPGFGDYYCDLCAVHARASYEMSWASNVQTCSLCLRKG